MAGGRLAGIGASHWQPRPASLAASAAEAAAVTPLPTGRCTPTTAAMPVANSANSAATLLSKANNPAPQYRKPKPLACCRAARAASQNRCTRPTTHAATPWEHTVQGRPSNQHIKGQTEADGWGQDTLDRAQRTDETDCTHSSHVQTGQCCQCHSCAAATGATTAGPRSIQLKECQQPQGRITACDSGQHLNDQ